MVTLIARGIVSGLLQLVLLGALLLIPAGTLEWPRAILFLTVYAAILLVTIVWLAIAAPSSLEARLEPAINRKQAAGDRVATAFIGLAVGAWMIFIPLDVFRWHLLPEPGVWVARAGALLAVAGYAVIVAALYQNAYATPVVRDQSERGHTLVDSGLYARVRHPFYTGFLIALPGLALWLQSYAAVLALPVVLASLLVRIRVEEAHLKGTLPGYADYLARVRYRLIPGIW